MRLLLGFLCAALLIGCADVPPGGTYVQQRPEQLTLYQDGYVIKPVAGSETLRANCDFFLIPELDAAATLQAPDIPLAHFGVVFAKEGRNLDGSTYCTNQQSWNGGSVAELAPYTAAACRARPPVGEPCQIAYIIEPRGYDPMYGVSLGDLAARSLIRTFDLEGYGAVALADDGAWAVFAGYDTRELADIGALDRCNTERDVPRACVIVYRWGPDHPNATIILR